MSPIFDLNDMVETLLRTASTAPLSGDACPLIYRRVYESSPEPRRWRSGLERSPLKRKVAIGCSNPSRDRPKS